MAAPKKQVDEITKSPLDTRDYRYLLLQNDMKVLLISDKDTDKAAAAMSVHVGKCAQSRGSRFIPAMCCRVHERPGHYPWTSSSL